MPTRRRKLSGGTFQNRKIRIGPRGGKYILKGGRKRYLSGGQACSKYRKTKDPKCDEQDGCQWVKGKGCTGSKAKPRSYKKDRPSPSESAKTYDLGTTKRGNDGKMWTVVANKNGVKRWKRN